MKLPTLVHLCRHLAIVPALLLPVQALADDWQWILTPYIWASDTRVDAATPRLSAEGGIDFEDLVDKVDTGAQLHLEVSRDRAGLLLDLTYLSISESESRQTLLPGQAPRRIETGLDLTLFEAAATYRVLGESKRSGVELILGARVIDTAAEIAVSARRSRDLDSSETLVDGLVGARFIGPIGEHWSSLLRVDFATGDSNFSWNAQAGLAYHFGRSDRFAALLLYRHMVIDYDTAGRLGRVAVENSMSGPALGLALSF